MRFKKIIALFFCGLFCSAATAYANDMEIKFEESYDFENYYMDGSKVTTGFENKDGVRMWELRQNTPNMLLDVVPADREGYGDMLRISTVSENAAVFYSHNNGTGNFLPEVKDGVFVIETEYYMTKESFPTKDTYIMCQMMTTQNNEYIFPYVIRRDGDNISLTRDININATPIYSGTFPDGKWIRIRTVFDYTWGKWFCTYIDENDESYWLAHGSNIPAVISNAGIRSARLTYNVTGNENGKTAQIFTDNFRCYKLNGVTTELEGYKAVKVIADEYSKLPRLTENIYTPAESNAFAEDFSSYKSVPAALSVGNGKWNGAVSGEYIGGIMQVVEAPENPEKRVLFMSNSVNGIAQAAHTWVAPKAAAAICVDGKIRVTDELCAPYVALTMQNDGVNFKKLIRFENGELYFIDTPLTTVQKDKWYTFNILLNEENKTAFISLTDGENIYDLTLDCDELYFENQLRLTFGNSGTDGLSENGGAYFGELALCSTAECSVESSLLKSKDLFSTDIQIDLKFTNFISKENLEKIEISDGEKTVEFDLQYAGNNVKNVVLIPKTLEKNTDYKIDFSNVKDILGNSVTPDCLTFKTGDPALMDVLDITSMKITKNGQQIEYLTSGKAKVEVNCVNASTEKTKASMILILYKGYVMEKVLVTDSITIDVDEAATFTEEIEIPSKYSDCRLSVCLWDGLEESFALTKSYMIDSVGITRQ